MLAYKILRAAEWAAFTADARFAGSPDDLRDGFIHMSTEDQLAATRARHFAGVADLWLVSVDTDALGPALRWEAARGGALFPHLYRPLEAADIVAAGPMPA